MKNAMRSDVIKMTSGTAPSTATMRPPSLQQAIYLNQAKKTLSMRKPRTSRAGPLYAFSTKGIMDFEEDYNEDDYGKIKVSRENSDDILMMSFSDREKKIIQFIKYILEQSPFSKTTTLKLAANKWLIDKIIGGESSKDVEEDLKEIEVFIDQGENKSDEEKDYLTAENFVERIISHVEDISKDAETDVYILPIQ